MFDLGTSTIQTLAAGSIAAAALTATASHASAVVVTGDQFDAVQLRSANSAVDPTPPLYGVISEVEIAGTPGVYVNTTEAGQKVYFGTTALAGVKLSDIQSISYTFAYKTTGPGETEPYNNFIVTDGASTGTVAATTQVQTPNGTLDYNGETWNVVDVLVSFSTSSIRFFEPSGPTSWTHGQTLTGTDLDILMDWEISNTRPLSAGEANSHGDPRGPVDHGFSINWGDSASGYLGERLIYNVEVSAVPEPASLALVALGGGAMLLRRRRID